ncbi:uncharacterized protein LOC143257550 [Tachypleus tridentatus]|uniref:uncharacterized protein LOC143257550 n=1 Tax=Tachypleus tridentatus TaxID=6853 RepID=UPI003FCFC715
MEDTRYEFRCPKFLDFNSPEEYQEDEPLTFFDKLDGDEQPELPSDTLVCEQEKQEFLTPESSPNTTNDQGHPVETCDNEMVIEESTSTGDVNHEAPPGMLSMSSNLQEKKPHEQINNECLSEDRNLRSHSLNDQKNGLEHGYTLRWTPARLQNSEASESDSSIKPAKKKTRRSETPKRDVKCQPSSPLEDNIAVRVKRSLSARTGSANSSVLTPTTRTRGRSFDAGSSDITKVSNLVAPSMPNCLKQALDKLQDKSKNTVTTEDVELLKIGEIRRRLAANRKKYKKVPEEGSSGPKTC